MPVSKQIRIKSAESMDAETFLKHINGRHTPIAGLVVVGKSNVPDDENEDLLRIWHRKQHESTEPIAHFHETLAETEADPGGE